MSPRKISIITLALALLAAPVAAAAQPTGKVPRIGVLNTGSPSDAAIVHLLDRFREGLRAVGYVEGQNIAIEYRWAEGRPERFPDLAADLVRRQVDLIVAHGTPAPLAAKRATSTIPVVMTSAGDPIGTGLIQSLARPGGNVTGLSFLAEGYTYS